MSRLFAPRQFCIKPLKCILLILMLNLIYFPATRYLKVKGKSSRRFKFVAENTIGDE